MKSKAKWRKWTKIVSSWTKLRNVRHREAVTKFNLWNLARLIPAAWKTYIPLPLWRSYASCNENVRCIFRDVTWQFSFYLLFSVYFIFELRFSHWDVCVCVGGGGKIDRRLSSFNYDNFFALYFIYTHLFRYDIETKGNSVSRKKKRRGWRRRYFTDVNNRKFLHERIGELTHEMAH